MAMSEGNLLVESALVDAAIEAHVDWREEEAKVRAAYRRWAAAGAGRADAYADYVIALGREERAAHRLARVARSCTAEAVPAPPDPPARWRRRRGRGRRSGP
jgi:hypothetical protein